MKSSRIMTLVLAAAVLAVVASGSAYAKWPGSDKSTFSDSGASWDQTISSSTSIGLGGYGQWDNYYKNNNAGVSYIRPSFSAVDGVGSGSYYTWDTKIYYNAGYNSEAKVAWTANQYQTGSFTCNVLGVYYLADTSNAATTSWNSQPYTV